MNLNKATLILLLACSSTFAVAQTSNLRKAKSSIVKFEELKGVGNPELGMSNLKDAKEAIDKAIEHDKTKDLAETWTIAALIESNIALAENDEVASDRAVTLAAKARELDTDNKNEENIVVAEQTIGQVKFNQGVAAWEAKNFKNAYDAFDSALKFLPGDTTLTYYSGLAAIQNEDFPNAVAKYKELLPNKEFSQHKVIAIDLSKLYLSMQDTANAIIAAQEAVNLYPEDNDAVIQNIELNLIAGNETKIISDIKEQVAKSPDNKNLHYYLGIAYSEAGEIENALQSYKKAIEIDPNYLEANTNTAVTIMNSIRDELNDVNANKELSNTEYNAQIEAIKNKIKEALPYLTKVVELEPNNADALRNLKSYYDFMQDEEASADLQKRIDELN